MKLPVPLLNLRVATPCPANWNEMEGDERARFCGQCSKHVYNLSSMSESAAAELIREKEGKLCVRFYQREDGTVLHGEDCPVGLAARQWRRAKSMAGAVASLVLMAFGLNRAQAEPPAGAAPAVASPTPSGNMIMGDMCVVPPKTSPTPAPSASPTPKSSR
ncbi:hypothetical protein BH09VER1_BH09VER1_02110 [soil metagenome]